MMRHPIGNNTNSKVIDLPDWIFDVDSDDEYDNDTSILQELDIDLNQIYKLVYVSLCVYVSYILLSFRFNVNKQLKLQIRSTIWIYFGPFYKFPMCKIKRL